MRCRELPHSSPCDAHETNLDYCSCGCDPVTRCEAADEFIRYIQSKSISYLNIFNSIYMDLFKVPFTSINCPRCGSNQINRCDFKTRENWLIYLESRFCQNCQDVISL
jgi:hypothetical protein